MRYLYAVGAFLLPEFMGLFGCMQALDFSWQHLVSLDEPASLAKRLELNVMFAAGVFRDPTRRVAAQQLDDG